MTGATGAAVAASAAASIGLLKFSFDSSPRNRVEAFLCWVGQHPIRLHRHGRQLGELLLEL